MYRYQNRLAEIKVKVTPTYRSRPTVDTPPTPGPITAGVGPPLITVAVSQVVTNLQAKDTRTRYDHQK